MPPEIKLPDRLAHLIRYCEKSCVAECCGIDAFDFSPLHVASYVSSYTGRISDSDIAEWELELDAAVEMTSNLPPDNNGLICSVAGMNQFFTRSDFDRFIVQIRHSLRMSPRLLDLSDQLMN